MPTFQAGPASGPGRGSLSSPPPPPPSARFPARGLHHPIHRAPASLSHGSLSPGPLQTDRHGAEGSGAEPQAGDPAISSWPCDLGPGLLPSSPACWVSPPPRAACSIGPCFSLPDPIPTRTLGTGVGAVPSGHTHLDAVHASLYLLQLHADLAVPDVAEWAGQGREKRSGRGAGPPFRLGNLPSTASPSPTSPRQGLPQPRLLSAPHRP